MPTVAGRGTTYNLPNYHGPLIAQSPEETPFTSAIGGLLGGIKTVKAVKHEWSGYDLRAASDSRQRLEGADAPSAENRSRNNFGNILEIHQEAVDVSYTKQATTRQFSGANLGIDDNPVLDEMSFQIDAQLKQVGLDYEASAITGTYQDPSDNTTPRKMRGILAAMSTNVIVKTGAPNPTKVDVIDLLQSVWLNGGIQTSGTATLMAGAALKRWLTKLFVTDAGYTEETRNVGGVSLDTILTDFGKLNVMLNRYVPAGTLAVVSLEQCKPVALEDEEKGVLYVEPLAKTGSSNKAQLYGELGLEYGNEKAHGKITGFATTAPSS